MAGKKGVAGKKKELTTELEKKIVAYLKAGNYTSTVCAAVGISESIFYEWLRRGENPLGSRGRPMEPIYVQFAQAVRNAQAEAEITAVVHLRKMMPKNFQAIKFYLERKFPDKWGAKDTTVLEMQEPTPSESKEQHDIDERLRPYGLILENLFSDEPDEDEVEDLEESEDSS